MTRTKHVIIVTMILLTAHGNVHAQYPPGDEWHNNPLGFEPLKLHTAMGFLVPAVAVATCLLLTKRDHSLTNRLSIYNEAGFSWGYKYPYTFLPQNNTGVNFQLRKFMSIGVEVSAYYGVDNYNNTAGMAVRPFARFYAVNKPTWRLYFESGGGLLYMLDEFPRPTDQDQRRGTSWNGTTKYGVGSEVALRKFTAIVFGVRHLHISNGNQSGLERNPSHDSNGFFVGINYRPH